MGVDEPIDGFMADAGFGLIAGEAAGDLLGRPTLPETVEDGALEAFVSFELRALPAACPGLLVCICGSNMGITRAGKYTELPRVNASLSSNEFGVT